MPRCPAQQSAASGQPSPAVLQQPGTHDATVILTDDGYSKCILCDKYVTEAHMQSARHKRQQAAHEDMLRLQQSTAHDANVIMADDGYHKCTLCNKYVTEDHLQSRQHKRLLAAQEAAKEEEPVAAANDEEDIFRSLGDDFRDADGQPAQQPEMTTTTWGYTYTRAEWDEWQARKVNETVNTYG